MKKLVALFTLATTVGISAKAQINIGAIQDKNNAPNAARHLPTFLGEGSKHAQITLFNPYFSLGSNFATQEEVRKYIVSENVTGDMIDETLSKLHPKDNDIRGSVDMALLNVAFNVGHKEGKPALSFGFGVNERVETLTLFNEELPKLIYKGNKQYAGRPINLAPNFNGVAFTEYYLATAFNITPASGKFSIRPAVRVSYLAGQASVAMPKTNSITLYTEPEGRYLDFRFNYEVNASLAQDSSALSFNSFEFDQNSFLAGAGNGYGVDLGLRVTLPSSISINVGVVDIGSIRFKKGVVNMTNHASYTHEGEDILFTEDQKLDLDSLARLAEPTYSHEAYTMSLPTKLILTGSKGFNRVETTDGGYYKHQLTLMYLQGFSNYLSATTKPYLALGYTRNFMNVLSLGANAGIGGTTGGSFGLLASIKAGALSFGINSNNIIPLIAPASDHNADLGILFGFAF